MTAGDHLALHIPPGDVRASQKQLAHRAAIAVFGDAADLNLFAHHHAAEAITRGFGRPWVSSGASQLGRIDASQADLFASACAAAIAIPAALDRDVWVGRRMRCLQQQGQRQRTAMQPTRQPVGHQAKANEWTAMP